MRILFLGDSITDAERESSLFGMGFGYIRSLVDLLIGKHPNKYELINRGVSGNTIVDLYSRIKLDCWNLEPDVISVLIGINDVWREVDQKNGVELDRFEKVYRMLIEETQKRLPNVKLMLLEPFVLEGTATRNDEAKPDRYEQFLAIYNYADIVKKLANEYGCVFVPLQEKFMEGAKINGNAYYLWDGVHPWFGGANLIAEEWMKAFKAKIDN